MLLSEKRAKQLLHEWTRDCGQILLIPSTTPTSCESESCHLAIPDAFQTHDLAAATARGATLRRAMEALSALACCAGLNSVENPAFWRRQFANLGGNQQQSTRQQQHQELMGLSLDVWEPQAMHAIGVALSHMASLTSLAFTNRLPDMRWLVYVLRRRQQRGLPRLTLRLPFSRNVSFREATLQSNCLVDMIPELVRECMDLVTLPLGTTAIQYPHKPSLMVDPFLDGESKSVFAPERIGVDVVAKCGARVLVMVPLLGLRWADEMALEDWQAQDATDDNQGITDPLGLASLDCTISSVALRDMVTTLAVVGRGLTCLQLNLPVPAVVPTSVFVQTLEHCRQLTTLVLTGFRLASVLPLVRAYERGSCRISTLVYRDHQDSHRPINGTHELLAVFCDPQHCVAKTLQVLTFVATAPLIPQGERGQAMIYALSNRNRRLQSLCLHAADTKQRELATRRLQNQPLAQDEPSKAALCTLLLALRIKTDHPCFGAFPVSCCYAIAELAATRPRRQVTWV